MKGTAETLINEKEYDRAPRANLRGANLWRADLRYANLQGANLRSANLQGADLWSADLQGADLRGADLQGADLRGADLWGANLRGADLRGADLRSADIRSADLRGANLQGADLWGADLRGADLRSADLQGADLQGADLWSADLKGAENVPPFAAAQTSITPEGDLIGYKKLAGGVICKLRIPADAKRSNATGRKCRAEYAIILEGEGASKYDPKFVYKVGETVRPTKPFADDRWNECAPGIHFYLTRIEAESD